MMSQALSAPEKFSESFDASVFDCGVLVLNDWLRRRAAQNELSGASRTYVVRAGNKIVGYYSLAVGAVAHETAPGRVKRNMPDPVPVMILGRLAVDKTFHGRGVGQGLLRDAVLRTAQASDIAGIRALLVHAINEAARRFYERNGFIASPINPLTLMITLAEAQKMMK